ncbi:hypothetical protein U737_10235 [Methylomonas sp. LW13]|uniref:hypothetical protein n=1 Tax=unclassified Methylomonas TaxID=2608980 RepID=UPI00051B382D|nr:hypothetical protein [Methylomonas sp. LW13]QBC27250.1 hypothetical protein U737_10235 [Methylomonas sp. LW13]
MKKSKHLNDNIKSMLIIANLILSGSQALASPYTIEANQTITGLSSPGFDNIINRGLVIGETDDYLPLLLENYGSIYLPSKITCPGQKLVNYAKGYIAIGGYFDCYKQGAQALIENSGTIAVTNAVGENIALDPRTIGGQLRPAKDYMPWTYIFWGKIDNKVTGKFIIDRNNGVNLCQSQGSEAPEIENRGYFEIAQGSTCNFISTKSGSYKQFEGETKVNGTFGSRLLDFQGGILTGTGTILKFPEQLWNASFSISPGNSTSPFGELTLTPEMGYSVFGDGTLNFVIGGLNNNSKLHVNGEAYIVGSAKIAISLKNGFMPNIGNSFTIITANDIRTDDFNQANLILPQLPTGRQWRFDNDGTSLKLSVI